MDVPGFPYYRTHVRLRNLGILAGVLLLEREVVDLIPAIVIVLCASIAGGTICSVVDNICKVKRSRYVNERFGETVEAGRSEDSS
jgi:hypothetical protein